MDSTKTHLTGWYSHLEEWLMRQCGFNSHLADRACAVWSELHGRLPKLPPPDQAGEIDGTFQMVWDLNEHHLEIDVLREGGYEWFYRNRTTGDYCGEDDLSALSPLPPGLSYCLMTFSYLIGSMPVSSSNRCTNLQ